jgi:hypothetical protein
MRFLMIFALLLASLGFGPAVSAQSHHEVAGQHHAGHERDDDGDSAHGETQPVAHVCPGCAFLAEPAPAALAVAPASLPCLPADPPSLQPFHANPIPPPPRVA